MANKTNKLTVAQTLAVMTKVAQDNPEAVNEAIAAMPEGDRPKADATTVAEKVAHMYAQATKATNRPKTPSRASIENERYAKQVLNSMNEDTILTLAWITENIPYVTSTQKATAIVNVLLKNGAITKTDSVNGHIAYKLAAKEDNAE